MVFEKLLRPAEMLSSVLRRVKTTPTSNPNHIAFTMQGCEVWAQLKGKSTSDTAKEHFKKVLEVMEWCVKFEIPMMTFYILPERTKEDFASLTDELALFLPELSKREFIHKNKVRIHIIGKWYDLPGRIVDSIKEVIEETRHYDMFFVNLCVNYDGREEILDACRLIAMQVKNEKIDPMSITEEALKEDLYTSYFLPPSIIVHTGHSCRVSSLLLWDSVDAFVYYTNKTWPEIKEEDIVKSLRYFENCSKDA